LRVIWDCLKAEKRLSQFLRDTEACRDPFTAATAVDFKILALEPSSIFPLPTANMSKRQVNIPEKQKIQIRKIGGKKWLTQSLNQFF
jgi:hypothetical protein